MPYNIDHAYRVSRVDGSRVTLASNPGDGPRPIPEPPPQIILQWDAAFATPAEFYAVGSAVTVRVNA
jgi:hypothetical protein